jgi:hypothetical protein
MAKGMKRLECHSIQTASDGITCILTAGFPRRHAGLNALPKIVGGILLLTVLLFSACDNDSFFGDNLENSPPTIRFVYGPPESGYTVYQIHLYWMGHDPDGKIDHYEYVIADGDPLGFDPADTTGLDKWTSTELTEIELEVSADEMDTTVTIDHNQYARYSKMHTFFVRAVDGGGARSETIYRSFNAFTLAPHIFITIPPPESTVKTQFLPPIIKFEWEGKDPIDTPQNYQAVDSVRFMHAEYSSYIVERLNKHPENFEDSWSPWYAFEAPGDSGKSTLLGDDEILELFGMYVFVVQAMDEAGAISSIFDEKTNVRCFMVKRSTGPLLTVREPYLGVYKFLGTECPVQSLETPAGFPLNFSWTGNASEYGAIVSTYRYGWDISDLSDQYQWDVEAGPFHKAAPQRRFMSGVHSFFIEATDNIGTTTLARIEISIVPLTMERDLLLIDDFPSEDFNQNIYFMPTETQHDEFWLDICSRAPGFDPDTDVYDTKERSFDTPDLRDIWRYKSVIWVYGISRFPFNAWCQTVNFTPEEDLDLLDCKYTYNILQFYMLLGGHLWACGRADLNGGLAACNPIIQYFIGGDTYTYTRNLFFPLYLKCEMITGRKSVGCTDTSGVNAMPYKNFCVSVLDKVGGPLRSDGTVPNRTIDQDGLTYAYCDRNDPLTGSLVGLPLELHLWEEVTKPGRYFEPSVRGFHFVEVYDPEYWMMSQGLHSQSCFHPIFRMRTRNAKSVLDNTTIAVWSTVHADVIANVPGAVAAPSVHLGFPPWYFNRDEMRAFADVIFRKWGILHR